MQPSGNSFLDTYRSSGNYGMSPTAIVDRKLAPSTAALTKAPSHGMLDYIPALTGGLGAILGGAGGTLVAPGAGTAVGGVAGAGVGQAAGKAIENYLTGDKTTVGDEAKQAALGAGGQLVGGVVGKVAGKVGGGILSKVVGSAADLTGKARGITAGAKVAGQDRLGVSGADELNQFLDSVGVKSGAAKTQLADLEAKHQVWGKQIGDTVKQANRSLAPTDLSAVKTGVDANISKIVGLPKTGPETALVGPDGKAIIETGGDVADHPYITNLYQDLGKVKNLEGLNDFRKQLDADAINYGRSSQAPDPVKEQIAKAFRSGVSEYIGDAIPDLKPLQNLYGKSADAQDFLKTAASNPKGIGAYGVTPVPGEVVQGAKSLIGKMGNATQNAGKAVAQTKVLGTPLDEAIGGKGLETAGAAAGQLAAGAAGSAQPVPPGLPATPGAAGEGTSPLGIGQSPSAGANGLGSDQIDYTAEARKILSSGADAKTQASQLDLLSKMQAIELAAGKTSSSKPLSSTAN
jgi:hypothetical protein